MTVAHFEGQVRALSDWSTHASTFKKRPFLSECAVPVKQSFNHSRIIIRNYIKFVLIAVVADAASAVNRSVFEKYGWQHTIGRRVTGAELIAAANAMEQMKSQRVVGVFDDTKSQEYAMEMFALEAPTCPQ